jgi:hypothetical protein
MLQAESVSHLIYTWRAACFAVHGPAFQTRRPSDARGCQFRWRNLDSMANQENTMSGNRARMAEEGKLAKLQRYARLAPNDPDIHLALAQELAALSRHAESATELLTVISLSPCHLGARKLLERLTGVCR